MKRIENAGDVDGNPTVTVKVINCGEYSEGDYYGYTNLSEDLEQYESLLLIRDYLKPEISLLPSF